MNTRLFLPGPVEVPDFIRESMSRPMVGHRTNAFRKVATNDLDEAIYASTAPVDGQLFVRTAGHVWCIAEGQ